MKPLIFSLFACLTGVTAVAQDVEAARARIKRSEADSNYIRLFPNTVTVRAYLGEKFSTFSLEDRDRGLDLDYRPNTILSLGVGVTYRGVGINISRRLPFHDTKEDRYGETDRYDIQVHRYRRKLAVDAYLQRYKGFHLNEKELAPGNIGEAEYPYFPKMRTLRLGATAMYVFNGDRFSMRSAVNQQEWQFRSAGSPMIGAAFFFNQISNGDSSVIPSTYPRRADIYSGSDPTRIRTYGLTFHGGYGYTYVYRRNWFASLAADVGFGPGYITSEELAGTRSEGFDFQARANLRASLGYSTVDWTVGIYAIAAGDRYSLPYKSGMVGTSQGIVRLVVARRFEARRKKMVFGII